MNKFDEKDASRLQKLMAKVIKEAEFKLGVNEFVDLFNEFDWVNKTLIPKIRDNIFQIDNIILPKEEEKKPPQRKARTTKAKK